MEFRIEQTKKKQYQKNIAGSLKSVRIIKAIAKILLLIGIVGGGLYAILNYIMPTLSIVTVNGVPQKDISWIIISTSFIVAPCLILSLALNTLSKNLAGGTNSARVDESLILTGSTIKYSYRQKHHSLSSERRVLSIDFNKMDSIVYDEKTHLLKFTGEILSEYYDDYKKRKPVDINTLEEFVICDYFTPSLTEALLSKGIEVND